MRPKQTNPPPEECPNCGALVPPRAKACPGCGADHATGWNDRATADRLGIPADDEEFDYERFTKEEFGDARPKERPFHWLWVVVALGLLFVLLRAYWPW